MRRIVFFHLVVLTILASCQSSKKASSAAGNVVRDEAELVISMKKTACYGTCPVYQIEIYRSGLVRLKGERHMELVGTYVSNVSQDQLSALVKNFADAEYFSFESSYKKAVSDLPTTFLYFSDGENSKTIEDYYGAPQTLKELENKVAELIDSLEWQKVQDEGK